MQTKAASNGVSLLRNLQLSRILINPIDNSITIPGGDNVQLRINGVEVTQAEIIAIRPTDVIRIEYIDNPGARYGNAGAVLNYIVKEENQEGVSLPISPTEYPIRDMANIISPPNTTSISQHSALPYIGDREI